MFIYLFIYGKCLFPWVGRQPGWAGRRVFLRGSALIKLHPLPLSLLPATLGAGRGRKGAPPVSVRDGRLFVHSLCIPCAFLVLLYHAIIQRAHPCPAGQDG